MPGDKEEGQECRAFHPSAVKAFKIQTRLNATTIAQEEAKKADQVEAVERSAAVLHELQGGAIDGGGDGGLLLKNLDLDLFREKLLDKLNQQAKAGDRPHAEDLRSIFWAAPHDPDEDFHWTRQISSWTLPGLLGMFGHSYTLRQLWGVWESLPLLQGPRQRGPKNKAQSDPPGGLGDPEGGRAVEGGGPSVSADRTGVAIGLPGHGQGPRGPGLPHGHPGGGDAAPGPGRGGLQGADDPAGGMRRAHLGPGEPPAVPKALMDRIGGPGALAEVKVNWRCNTKQWWVGAVPDSVAPSIYRKLGYTNDMIKLMGLDPSAPGCRDRLPPHHGGQRPRRGG